MHHLNILYLPIILGWTIPIFIYKIVSKHLSSLNIFITQQLIVNVFLIFYFLYSYMYDKNTINNFNKSIKNTPISLMLGLVGIVILAFAARICFIDLVKEYEATTLIPNLRAGSTLLTIIIGYFLFKEQMSIIKLGGIILIFVGIYLLNN